MVGGLLARLRAWRRRPPATYPGDLVAGISPRLPWWLWAAGLVAVVGVYTFCWSFVHVRADSRVCMGHSPDPLFPFIPHDRRWTLVSHDVYIYMTFFMMGSLGFLAFGRGDERPLVRWGLGLALSAAQRCVTILLVPLCAATVPAGTRRLTEIPTVDLGLLELPWRPFATNDLLFSGHVAEIYLFLRVTRGWPAPLRAALWAYYLAMVYALLATRGHYTIDILVAYPCCYVADRVAVRILAWAGARREARRARLQAVA